jgi:hypothetical protein
MTNPSYPVYIISKKRHEDMYTSRCLSSIKIHHYIAIEPQNHKQYLDAIEKFNIQHYVTLIILPFSNHGDGPGRARNYCWEHSLSNNNKRHWVLDDNIDGFYRFQMNKRLRVGSSAIFRAAEDFVDRYENILISGFTYRSFMIPNDPSPSPYIMNTRIYSCLLIDNSCPYRWRGRYNEDTDLSLRVLKDGYCTVQFNAFLQNKMATQKLKGGNTDEFYKKEGTLLKSQMLVDMHPDVTKLVWKYDRWHHYVDYSPFKKNKLILKKNIIFDKLPNEYGMILANISKKEKSQI